jgi:hypothetical protein
MRGGFILAGTDTNQDIIIRFSTDLSGSSYTTANIVNANGVSVILDNRASNNFKYIKHHDNIWVGILTYRDTNTNINTNLFYSTNGGIEWKYIPDMFVYSADYGKINNSGANGWLFIGYDINTTNIVLYKYNSNLSLLIDTAILSNANGTSGIAPEFVNGSYIVDEFSMYVTLASDKNNTYMITSDMSGIFMYDSSLNSFTIGQNYVGNDTINLNYLIDQATDGDTYLNSIYDMNNHRDRIYMKTLYSSGKWTLLVTDKDNLFGSIPDVGRIIMKTDAVGSKWTIKYASNNTFNYSTNIVNVMFADIATNGTGTWVAVGKSDSDRPTDRGQFWDGLIVYSTNNGDVWSEIIIDTNRMFNGITYQNNYWVATTQSYGTSTEQYPNKSAIYISNNLTSWIPIEQTDMTIYEYSIQGGSFDLQCLLKGTGISTPEGYISIENLKIGDKVITSNGSVKEITNVYMSHVLATDKTQPYIIPVGELGAIKDVYISPTHSVRASNGELIEAQFLGYKQANIEGIIEYYNISLGGNRNNMILAEGVAVESMGKDLQKTVLDISSYPSTKLFSDTIRNSHIVKLHTQYNIPIKVLQGYPDSYIQELLFK